jgi:hypothetical protein
MGASNPHAICAAPLRRASPSILAPGVPPWPLCAERKEQRAKSKEQRAKSKEQRAKSKEQRAKSKQRANKEHRAVQIVDDCARVI